MSNSTYIRQLDSHVIDQIAAGEVVDRPASIAKELVENAMDAGATSVQVDLEGGGLSRISVSDDGVGMSSADLRLCWHRHATSKLENAADLFHIETFGFRGEALSSIASISQMAVTTRRSLDDAGQRLVVRAGEQSPVEPVAAPRGTTIEVSDLFFNTPARKKFLRSPATEQAHVQEACLRVALGARRGGLLLTAGTRRLLDIPPDTEGLRRAEIALGKRVKDLQAFGYQSEDISVHGYVSAANVDRGDTKGIWFFVNGRYVRDRMLARVTTDAFREMVDRGRYPNLIVYLDVSPEAIDVNVHPQKLEVRFSDGASVYRILAASLAVAAAVARDAAPQNSEHQGRVEAATHRFFRAESRVREGHPPVRKSSITQGEPGRQADDWAMPSSQASSAMKAPRRDEYEENSTSFSTHRWGEYIAHFVDDSLVVACPKKARQQLCYVQLLAECERGCVANRALMLPPVIEVSRDVSPDRLDRLSQAGFVFEVVGPHRLGLVSMPQAIPDSQGDLVAAALQAVLVAGVGADEDVLSRVCLALFTDTQLPLSRTEVEQLRVSSPRLHGGPCFAIHSREEMVRSLRGA